MPPRRPPLTPAQLWRLLEGLTVFTAAVTAVVRVVIHRTGRAWDRHPERAFALYLRAWAILGVLMGVAAPALAWYVGIGAARRGPCGIAFDLALAALAFPLLGALLFPVAVMSYSANNHTSSRPSTPPASAATRRGCHTASISSFLITAPRAPTYAADRYTHAARSGSSKGGTSASPRIDPATGGCAEKKQWWVYAKARASTVCSRMGLLRTTRS
jgi:hypothetical protein